MATKRGIDQCRMWLRSKAAELDTLDAINAEMCLRVIEDLQKEKDRLGGIINNLLPKKPKMQENEQIFMDFTEEEGK